MNVPVLFQPRSINVGKLWACQVSTVLADILLGGVYTTPGRLSPRREFAPVPSHGSIIVYMIPLQNAMSARVTPA